MAQDKTINWAGFLFDPRWIENEVFNFDRLCYNRLRFPARDEPLPAGLAAEIPNVALVSKHRLN
jgi:hypothetical protein